MTAASYTEITKCRVCGKTTLIPVLSLGEQALTGVFPKTKGEQVSKGNLDLVWCSACGLLQMKQSYNLSEMYGMNYGYRSGLNQSMVNHLASKARYLERLTFLTERNLVVDIGSNDGTLLNSYETKCIKVGIDPTAAKFRQYYNKDVDVIPEFFPSKTFDNDYADIKAKIITSIAMFYDLEDPTAFVRAIEQRLADDGIWHFEQSYMPSMLRMNAYDAVCHEHLEFYSYDVLEKILRQCNLRVVDIQMNAVNGGSIAITACKKSAPYQTNIPISMWLRGQESNMHLNTPTPYRQFEERVYRHRKDLYDLVNSLVNNGDLVLGYGASTKGNVLLQFCGLTEREIPCIADVNPDKFGCYTPGTGIPIVSEKEAREMHPDYFLVFPWHFKNSILEREKEFTERGGRFIFPLPEIEIV